LSRALSTPRPQPSALGRRILNAVGTGVFEGPKLRGELIAGTGDWMLVRRDGVRVIDARVVLRTDDDAIIHMSYGGRFAASPDVLAEMARDRDNRHLVSRSRYYMRTTPTFETGAPAYAWLNDVMCVASGWLTEGGGVAYAVYQVM
jgi:hypothetical protein